MLPFAGRSHASELREWKQKREHNGTFVVKIWRSLQQKFGELETYGKTMRLRKKEIKR